jgi:flavodoxin
MMKLNEKKCLIAYYSRKGQNIASGRIVNLPIGNTEAAAQMIRQLTEGNVFRIDTVNTYPVDYTETTEAAQKEKRENARPEISGQVDHMDAYHVIFLGYPNWWGTMPMAVCTFLEAYDFSGKTIIPFCTHEGSGLGHSEKDIAKLCPKAALLKGLAIHGSRVHAAKQEIADWLNKIEV